MAVQVEILEIKLDTDELTKNAIDAKEALKDLNTEQKELEKQGETNSKVYQDNAKELVNLKQKTADNNKELNNQVKANNAAKGSNDQLRAQLALQTKQYNALSKEQRENTKEGKALQGSIKGISDELKSNEEAVGDNRRSVGDYGKALGGLGSPIASAVSGFASMTTGALAFIATPIGAVIAALGLIIGALTQFFSDNEEGQNALNKITAVLSATFKVFTDIVSDIGAALFKAFSDPKQLLIDFAEFVKTNLINRFKAFGVILEGIINLDFGQLKDGVLQLATGVEDFSDKASAAFDRVREKVSEIGDAIERNIALAIEQAEITANLNLLEREALVANARAQRDIAKLRLDAKDEENLSNEERLAAIQEAGRLEEQILDRNLNIAQQRLRAAQLESAQGKDTIEDKQNLAQLEAELFRVEETNFSARRKLIGEENTLIRAVNAEQAEAAELQAEQERLDFEISDFLNQTLHGKVMSNIDAEREARDEARQAENQARIDSFDETIRLINEELDAKEAAAEQAAAIARLESNAKISAAKSGFDIIAAGTAEGSAISKAAGISSAIISTYQGANGAIASLSSIPIIGPSLGFAAAAAIIAAGFSNVGKIASAAYGGIFQGNGFGAMSVGGRSHAAGGTKYFGQDGNRFEVERGEIIAVVNKRSAAMINGLSALNQLGGGVAFGSQGSGFYQNGGIALSAAGNRVEQRIESDQAVANQLADLPPNIVFVEDIRAAVESQVMVENAARS